MRILTTEEIRLAERHAVETQNIPTLKLMEQAGYATARFCMIHFKFDSVCVICGKGNNGGDGFVAAQALSEIGKKVSVLVLARGTNDLSPDAAQMCKRLSVKPIWISKQSDFDSEAVQDVIAEADLMLDAVVGTGFKPPLKGLAETAVDIMNDFDGDLVCVDLPSGVDADRTTQPDIETENYVVGDAAITFIAPKPVLALGEVTDGPIAVCELGVQVPFFEDELEINVATAQDVAMVFPPRRDNAHKGDFGHVLVIAGSLGKSGAAALAGMAALRTGAGLVTVACPKSVQATIAATAPELMTEGLPETDEGTISLAAEKKLSELLTGKDAIVMGPGLSRNEETAELVRRSVSHCPLPLVLDADGLNAFDGHYGELNRKGDSAPFLVLTPHPGEAARLAGISAREIQEKRIEAAHNLAKDTNACVVLKGWRTIIAGPADLWINMSGNPAMAKGGSGDVLAGMIGAALARHQGRLGWMKQEDAVSEFDEMNALLGELYKVDPTLEKLKEHELVPGFDRVSDALKIQKVAATVHLHGLAGDMARDFSHENSVVATDLIDYIAKVFRECDAQVENGLFYLRK